MLARISGRSIAGFRIEPRSPPVQVTTWTSTPWSTYIRVLAAPLLDSSSGCACTCINRRSPVTGPSPPHLVRRSVRQGAGPPGLAWDNDLSRLTWHPSQSHPHTTTASDEHSRDL